MTDKQKQKLDEKGGDYADLHNEDCQEGCDIPDPTRVIKGGSNQRWSQKIS